MTEPTVIYKHRALLPKLPTYIAKCCREWVMAIGHRGRCGICGEKPEFLRSE